MPGDVLPFGAKSSQAIAGVRELFPALKQEVHDKPLVYLDSAASALKPQPVIDAVNEVYSNEGANIHRAVHLLSQRSTAAYEKARKKVRDYIHAQSVKEIIFTRSTTESINLVAQSWGRSNLNAGDEILLTCLEHHSNIVPWQMIAEQTGAKVVVVPITDSGEVPVEWVKQKLNPHTKMVAIAHASNALGTILAVQDIVKLAKEVDACVLVDGAQAAPHLAIDVQALGCDFYAFSGHKLYGPNGIGVLYGKQEHLESMPPYQGGGDMISSVTFEKTLYNELPYKFEAGTPHIAGAIGLGAAIDFMHSLGIEAIAQHERSLLRYATESLEAIDGLNIVGTAPDKVGVVSFVLESVHPHDVGTVVDAEGVAIRTGHHCAQPVMERFEIAATARASFGMYNTKQDVDALVGALGKVKELFG